MAGSDTTHFIYPGAVVLESLHLASITKLLFHSPKGRWRVARGERFLRTPGGDVKPMEPWKGDGQKLPSPLVCSQSVPSYIRETRVVVAAFLFASFSL
jgi:hypothetical protein